MGTIETTCAIMTTLMQGRVHDRKSLARDFGITVASADRYLRHLLLVPGVHRIKRGRTSLVSFTYSEALKAIGQ
jgi:hypothetical protein